ncbi:MAG: sigma-70 family RNA polymerase sigma factor [Treponema sp.]|nr:sigma-70 family RNA polymerase sigma factor [Treponema sp.]
MSNYPHYNTFSADEEYQCALRVKNGDKKAREHFILANIPFAIHYSKGFRGYKLEREDLISEAIVGLIRAVDRFDAEKGFRFTTYAKWYIRNEIQRAAGKYVKTNECDIDDEAILSALEDDLTNPIEEKYMNEAVSKCVQDAINSLSKKEADVIIRHYGFGNTKPQSFSSIADCYGLTKTRIHQIEKAAFSTLKNALNGLYA